MSLKTQKAVFSFLIILTISISENLASPRVLSLEQCISIAQEQSPSSKIARSAYSASMLSFDAFSADFLPQLRLSGSAPGLDRSINPITQPDGSIEFRPQSQLFTSVALQGSQKLPITGGEFFVSSSVNRIDLWGSRNDYYWNTTPFQISYRQPLFQLNSMRWDIELQKLQQSAAVKRFNEAMEDIAADITEKFFNLYIAEMNVENAKKNVEINDTLYQISLGRYNVGRIAENDLLQSELGLLNVQNELENARLEYLQNLEELKLALGLERLEDIGIIPPLVFRFVKVDSELALRSAIQNRSDAEDFEIRRVNAQRNVSQARADNFFGAVLTASYGLNQTAGVLPEAYRNMLDQERININFQMPIFQWGKGSAKVESALAEQNSVETSVELKKQSFELEVKYQTLRFEQLQNQVSLRAKADTVATRRFDVAKNRFLIGKIDLNTFFIAQNEKDMALRSYIQTLKSYWTSYYRLRRLTLFDFVRGLTIKHKYPGNGN